MSFRKTIILILTVLLLTSCEKKTTSVETYTSTKDLNGKIMGCMSGSIFDKTIENVFPDSQIIYFNSRSELLLAMQSGKIVSFVSDEPVAMLMAADNDGITYFDEPIGKVDYAICFSNDKINVKDEYNEYLDKISKNGHLKELQDKWICKDGGNKVRNDYELTGVNGTLKCATTPDSVPFSFLRENKFQGFECELLYEFAYEYGYDLKVDLLSFDALLTSVATGKYDIALNGIFVTDERKKSVNFSDIEYSGNVVVMAQKDVIVNSDENIIDKFLSSVYHNFIEEDRYKLLLSGAFTTTVISVLSIILGSLVGLLIYCLSIVNKVVKKLADILQEISANLPILIVLMILFYVVFNNSTLDGVAVSIVGFSVTFAFIVYGLIKTGVAAVPNNQFESAIAMGYREWVAFFKLVFPQAVKVVFGTYKAEALALLKGTSVVGYVSVNDLTRMSDIIRGRTFDALLPLITDAIVYFFLCVILSYILKFVFNNLIWKGILDD